MSTTPEKKNAPVHKERLGAVEAAIWENRVGTEGQTRLRVTLSKSYKDGEGNWNRTSTLDAEDLSFAAQVLERCNTWVTSQRQALDKVDEVNPLEEYFDENDGERQDLDRGHRGSH